MYLELSGQTTQGEINPDLSPETLIQRRENLAADSSFQKNPTGVSGSFGAFMHFLSEVKEMDLP